MEYTKSIGGAWLDADTVKDGTRAKIINECEKQLSSFKDPKTGEPKVQNVAKVQLEGEPAPVNMRFNWTTIYGLIDAFGKESRSWIGQPLTVKTVEAMVGDTIRTIVYLIPEGFELTKNEEKKLEIRRKKSIDALEMINEEVEGIPF